MDPNKALLHLGCRIEVATYGTPPVNVAIECIEHHEVIVDADVIHEQNSEHEEVYE